MTAPEELRRPCGTRFLCGWPSILVSGCGIRRERKLLIEYSTTYRSHRRVASGPRVYIAGSCSAILHTDKIRTEIFQGYLSSEEAGISMVSERGLILRPQLGNYRKPNLPVIWHDIPLPGGHLFVRSWSITGPYIGAPECSL